MRKLQINELTRMALGYYDEMMSSYLKVISFNLKNRYILPILDSMWAWGEQYKGKMKV